MEPSRIFNYSDMDDRLDFEADEAVLTIGMNIFNGEQVADQEKDNSAKSIPSEWQPLIDLIQPAAISNDGLSNAENNADQNKVIIVRIIGDLIKSNEAGILNVDALSQLFKLIGCPQENNHLNVVYGNGIDVIEIMQHIAVLKREKEKFQKTDNQNVGKEKTQLTGDLMPNHSEVVQPTAPLSLQDVTENPNNEMKSKEGLESKPCIPTFLGFYAEHNGSIFDPLTDTNLDTPIINVPSPCVPVEEPLPTFSPASIVNRKNDDEPEKSKANVKINAPPKAISPIKRAPLRRKNVNSKHSWKPNIKERIIQNKYVLLDKIGSGTYGKVYKGQNYFTNEIVAVKRIFSQCKPEAMVSS